MSQIIKAYSHKNLTKKKTAGTTAKAPAVFISVENSMGFPVFIPVLSRFSAGTVWSVLFSD